VAGSQRQLDFTDLEFKAHLRRCGFESRVQCSLAWFVWSRGQPAEIGGDSVRWIKITTRELAAEFKCSDRAVAKAAATLSRQDWFREGKGGHAKPSTYAIKDALVRSLEPIADQLGDLWANLPEPSPNLCEPVRTSARILPANGLQNPCNHPNRIHSTASPAGFGQVRTSSDQIAYPWARKGGVTDAELVAAVRQGNQPILRLLYDHALHLEWINDASERTWFDFLVACHHAATARLQRRMGRLVAFVKNGLDVSRTTQGSDQWAGEIINQSRRDPELAALGRLMPGRDD
jgi:hypothetical protein